MSSMRNQLVYFPIPILILLEAKFGKKNKGSILSFALSDLCCLNAAKISPQTQAVSLVSVYP